MNIIRKCYFILVVLIAFSFRAPNKKHNHLLLITKQIDNVEYQYLSLSDEKEDNQESIIKNGSEELNINIKRKLRTEIDKSYSKTRAINGGQLVGVIKSGSCGNNSFLQIYMDCEDDEPRKTKKYGWVGDCNITTGKNVYLRFCIVEGYLFHQTTVDYAVLLLEGNPTPHDEDGQRSIRITRTFDNQTDRNFGGTEVENHSETLLDWEEKFTIGGNDFGYNMMNTTTLDFLYFEKIQNTGEKLPSLDIDYGVFGRFGKNQGYIYTDDEDDTHSGVGGQDHNHNSLDVYPQQFIIGGSNTVMFISHMDYCNSYTHY